MQEREEFSIGRAFGAAFPIWIRNFIPFMVLGAIASAPLLLYVWSLTGDMHMTEDGAALMALAKRMESAQFILAILTALSGAMVMGMVAFGVVQQLHGRPAGFMQCLGMGVRRLFPVLGTAILLGLIMFVPLIVGGLLFKSMGKAGVLLAALAVLAVLAAFYVALPAAVMEGGSAIGRSSSLTEGRRGAIFGMLAVVGVVQFAANQLLETVLLDEMMSLMGDPDALLAMLRKTMWIAVGVQLVISVFLAVLASVTYYLLRREKEGTSTEELAAVFD